jgi:hypothetical protein
MAAGGIDICKSCLKWHKEMPIKKIEILCVRFLHLSFIYINAFITLKLRKIMKTVSRTLIFSALLIVVALLSGCSNKPDMDTPMKASTIDEYCNSMMEISKALDPEDSRLFLEALETVAFGPSTALSYKMGGVAMASNPGKVKNNLTRLAKKCNGKTPREIILLAEASVQEE